jgi:dolichol-phosphate mannosyltransferase
VIVNASTYNERENISQLIDRVLATRDDLHMLVVDDNSPDGTGTIALERSAANQRLHVLVRRGRRGLGSAILEGLRVARDHGFDIAVYMDADLSHDPEDIPRLLAAMDPPGGIPADLAIGSRRVPGGKTVGWPISREIASRLVCWFTRWVLWVPVHDASGGFARSGSHSSTASTRLSRRATPSRRISFGGFTVPAPGSWRCRSLSPTAHSARVRPTSPRPVAASETC